MNTESLDFEFENHITLVMLHVQDPNKVQSLTDDFVEYFISLSHTDKMYLAYRWVEARQVIKEHAKRVMNITYGKDSKK